MKWPETNKGRRTAIQGLRLFTCLLLGRYTYLLIPPSLRPRWRYHWRWSPRLCSSGRRCFVTRFGRIRRRNDGLQMLLCIGTHFSGHYIFIHGEQSFPFCDRVLRLVALFLDQRAPVMDKGNLLICFSQGIEFFHLQERVSEFFLEIIRACETEIDVKIIFI